MAASAAHSPSYVGSHILASALTSCSVNILVTMYKKRINLFNMKSDAGMHIKKTYKQGSENIKVRVNIQTLIHPCIIVK